MLAGVIGAAAELCAGLLAACDDVRLLATSREPLAVAGEARYRLVPLALPDPDDLAEAARAEAVALFTDRARSADAQFALTSETTPTVARLVARLDGMPLAIELAAARVEALGVAQLLDRIGDRFALLAGGDRTAAPRQRSLAATVEWSYRLRRRPNEQCSARCRCSRARSRWRRPRRSPGPTLGRRCCGWSTARCWCRRVPGRMAGPATGCWRRCAPTGPDCSPGPGSRRKRPPPGWPGTRCGWPQGS